MGARTSKGSRRQLPDKYSRTD